MKTKIQVAICVSAFVMGHSSLPALAATTIDAANKYAYGANIGWMEYNRQPLKV